MCHDGYTQESSEPTREFGLLLQGLLSGTGAAGRNPQPWRKISNRPEPSRGLPSMHTSQYYGPAPKQVCILSTLARVVCILARVCVCIRARTVSGASDQLRIVPPVVCVLTRDRKGGSDDRKAACAIIVYSV